MKPDRQIPFTRLSVKGTLRYLKGTEGVYSLNGEYWFRSYDKASLWGPFSTSAQANAWALHDVLLRSNMLGFNTRNHPLYISSGGVNEIHHPFRVPVPKGVWEARMWDGSRISIKEQIASWRTLLPGRIASVWSGLDPTGLLTIMGQDADLETSENS